MRKYILLITSALFISQFSFSKENAKPIIIDQLQRFSLAEQMPMSNNYDVRMRKIVVASGAKISEHGHTDRAGMVYVISGEIVEYRNDKVRTLKSGDSIIEDFNTVHAYENKSNQDCILIAFDIPKSETNKHLEKFIGK
ncbi:MAG: quercetin dioxygenase-like cupin family protein [Polaribacter sp.]|jgi:quercetin dioxygenase-like cupin family protein